MSQASAVPESPTPTRSARFALVALVGCAAGVVWAFWPTIMEMVQRWTVEKNYSHGFLVPLFSAYVFWSRRKLAKGIIPGPFVGGAIGIFLLAALLRAGSGYFYFDWLDGASLIVYITGLAYLWGGRKLLLVTWPALAFLVFMVPLPYRFERALSLPLQRFATKASTYSLQTLGIPAYSEGNVINLREVQMGIVESCNGLGMLMSFVALSAGLVIVSRAPILDKLILVASAIPIALICNVIRIVVTGVVYEMGHADLAQLLIHDLAGWFMMPIALGFLWLEQGILSRLFITIRPYRLSPLAGKDLSSAAKHPSTSVSAASTDAALSQGGT